MDKASFVATHGTGLRLPEDGDEILSTFGSEVRFGSDELDRFRGESDLLATAAMGVMSQEMDDGLSVVGEESDEEDSGDSLDARVAERDQQRMLAREELTDLAMRLTKISAVQMTNTFRRGRVAQSGPRMIAEAEQRVFGLEGTEALTELETAGGLYETLTRGQNVIVQYMARTGIGKTTRFPGLLAKKCALRVLLLQPDELLAKAAGEAQRDKVRVRRSWSRQRVELVTPMTYADFCGQFQTKNGQMLLQQFDVFLLDEAHVPYAEVYVTKAILATFAPETASVIVLSATVDGEDMQAMNVASRTEKIRGTMSEAVKAGKFSEGVRCRDRTMLIVASDEEVGTCADVLIAAGHKVYTLDSANRHSDCEAIRAVLSKQSVVKRFLITVEKFGTGHNFPLSVVYTDASRLEYQFNEDTHEVSAAIVPIMQAEVKQHCARVNRGIVEGGKSYVFLGRGEPAMDVEILESEKLKAFLLLRAAGIKPLAHMCPKRGFFPFGVTPSVAADILAINLPCALAVRFFCEDGRVTPAFARALAPFSQIGHHFITSTYKEPIGFENWKRVPMGGYYGGELRPESVIAVPFDVEESALRVKLHAICAIARGYITIAAHMPSLSDSEGSGDEAEVVTVKRGMRLPRLVEETERRSVPPPREAPWGFDARLEGQLGFSGDRRGIVIDEAARATMEFLRTPAAMDRVVSEPEVPVMEEMDKNGVSRINIMSTNVAPVSDSPVDVKTPGGTVVVQVRKTIWELMVTGSVLDTDEVYSLLYGIRHNVQGFVRSAAFANWSNVWLSVLRSFAVPENLRLIERRNLRTVMTALLHALYVKYSLGVQSVTESSHAKSRTWKRILRGRTVEEQLERDRACGRIEVMQSESWFKRVTEIRVLTARALSAMNQEGIFMPQTTTMVQNVLPITESTGDKHIDGLMRGGRGVVPYVKGRTRHSSVSSSSSVNGKSHRF